MSPGVFQIIAMLCRRMLIGACNPATPLHSDAVLPRTLFRHFRHYSLRHGRDVSYSSLRSWVLEGWAVPPSSSKGKGEGAGWVLLMEHRNDPALSAGWATHTWPLMPLARPGGADVDPDPDPDPGCATVAGRSQTPAFSKFRVRMTGPHSFGTYSIYCSGFEVYGSGVCMPTPQTILPAPRGFGD